MTNYTVTSNPVAHSVGSSATMRAEFPLIATAIASKADHAGQVYTGTHDHTGATLTAPTQTQGDNSTKAATTAYADAIKSYGTTTYAPLASPTFTGTVTIPGGASIAGYALIASPTFTGVPAAPTATAGTNTTQLATTAFVAAQAFSTALPSQTGNSGKLVTTDGTNASWTASPTFTGYTETVYALSGTTPAFSEANGSIQTWTLSGASTPTDSLTTGQSLILIITPGAYSITWPTLTWTKVGGGGAAPTLYSAGKTTVILWKIGSTLYASHLGDM